MDKFILSALPIDRQVEFLHEEISRMSIVLNTLVEGNLNETHIAPEKPYTGMIRLADGTNWNPGSGRGVYWYDLDTTSWNKL